MPWSLRSRVGAALGILAGVLVLLATPARASAGTTERVSVDSAGAAGNDWSDQPTISADGRFVTFSSSASNLVPGDTQYPTPGSSKDLFVRDRSKWARMTATSCARRSRCSSDGGAGSPMARRER
jgi:hypothetical protein